MPFYKLDESNVVLEGNTIHSPIATLISEDKDKYTYPIDGWFWFENMEMADTYFKANPDTNVTEIEYITNFVQLYLDNSAKERNYDSILSLCTYVDDPDSQFAAEGLAGIKFRSSVWRTCYNILGEYETGQRSKPTVDDILLELPKLVW